MINLNQPEINIILKTDLVATKLFLRKNNTRKKSLKPHKPFIKIYFHVC